MNITDNILTFDSNDLKWFSDPVKAALTTAAGETRTPEELLSDAVNETVAAAVASHRNSIFQDFKPIADAMAAANDLDAQAARVKLDEVRDALKVSRPGVVLTPAAEEPKGLFARLFGG